MPIRVGDFPELRAAALAMKRVGRELRGEINRATVSTMGPVWKNLIESRTQHPLSREVLMKGARVKGGNPPTLLAAKSVRRFSGGLIPGDQWAAFEFGADRTKTTTYDRTSTKGARHRVTRHTRYQLPKRKSTGWTVFPAVGEFAPRLVSLWVQIVVRKIHEAAEGK